MGRITSKLPDTVVQYRKMLAALRGTDLQVLDTEVWEEYMQNHPLTDELGYPNNERNEDD